MVKCEYCGECEATTEVPNTNPDGSGDLIMWKACEGCKNDILKMQKESENKDPNMQRRGLVVSISQLHELIEDLYKEFKWDGCSKVTDDERKFQVDIINPTPECSDTWELESLRE